MELKLGSFYFKSGERLDYVANLFLGLLSSFGAIMMAIGFTGLWAARDSLISTSLNAKLAATNYDVNVIMVVALLQCYMYGWLAIDSFKYIWKKK